MAHQKKRSWFKMVTGAPGSANTLQASPVAVAMAFDPISVSNIWLPGPREVRQDRIQLNVSAVKINMR